MRKALLSIAILASLAAPAAAQVAVDEGIDRPLATEGARNPSGDPTMDPGVDGTVTRSIGGGADTFGSNSTVCGHGAGVDPYSNPQCEFFGANSR